MREEYEMLAKGKRTTFTTGVYPAVVVEVLIATGWTYEQYLSEPDDLVAQIEARVSKIR